MRGKKLSIGLNVVLALFVMGTIMASTHAAAQTETVLINFNRNDKLVGGLEPDAGLIFDGAGNLYGTTIAGGTECAADAGCGTVFKLTPKAGGGWAETVLHNFNFNGQDGVNPAAGVIFDGAGNLYGTTLGGGAYGYGTVFELERTEAGGFAEKILHSFGKNASDGQGSMRRRDFGRRRQHLRHYFRGRLFRHRCGVRGGAHFQRWLGREDSA